ncbi:right-handed parallel beta-helix repeat-containing protein [bacterium]|nr:right-handed parallel beta-helix repeat-containing protein [bacterium]
MNSKVAAILVSILLIASCGGPQAIQPGDDVQRVAQRALIMAKPGDTVRFVEGTFLFNKTLSLDVENVTIAGAGPDKTILKFADQVTGSGGEGLLVTKGGFTLQNLAVEDSRGDAIKVTGVDGVTLRNVRVEWTRGPSPENGAYGLYPVESRNVLIEGCTAIGASDAGIYVGQCDNIIVRNNVAKMNVTGIEVENSVGADVYNNVSTDNTGGVLVFQLPNLPKKESRQCRVFNNVIKGNNRENFAKEGTLVSGLPPGGGLILMATDEVEVFGNTIADNDTANLSIISFQSTKRKVKDKAFDPFCESIHIHSNTFTGGGTNPVGDLGKAIKAVFGTNGPDIVYDGVQDPKKLVDGRIPDHLGISIHDNGDATFANLDLEAMAAGRQPNVVTDLSGYAKAQAALPEITIKGVQ